MNIYHHITENFAKSRLYQELLCPNSPTVHEKSHNILPPPVSERQLQCVWADARWRPNNLQSLRTEKVTVINAGRWNLEAGPDFLDAILLIGTEQRRVQGDIEIHIRPSDWNSHKHQKDPRYNRVIAHVCFYPGELPADSLPAGTIQLSLADSLRETPHFSFENIDITAYPYAIIEEKLPPCTEILHTWSPEKCEELLEAAGEERLRLKTTRMNMEIQQSNKEQSLYVSIMNALGYKQNRKPFQLLAQKLPVEELRNIAQGSSLTAYALLLGVAGLIPNTEQGYDNTTRIFIRSLWDQWWKHKSQWDENIIPAELWRTDGLRPQNHPIRRLAAAAAIFSQPDMLSAQIEEAESKSTKTWLNNIKSLLRTTASFDYWEHRLTFQGKESTRTTVLLGEKRIASIITNVIIPYLAATGHNITPLLTELPSEQDNALVRRTAFNLFGRDHNPTMYNSGLRQQGLLQIFYDFCLNMRNGCPDCELAAGLSRHTSQPETAPSMHK
ncbi:MAG: DUF2851 family protein [Kiritimatiellae bacterium]|nr:DUF2851 family protein [Kiritimatiellia bacterium]